MIKTVKVFETGSVLADIILENTAQNVVLGRETADLGVVMPGFRDRILGKCAVLLVPQSSIFARESERVITYGMAPDSTITLSSVGEEKCVMTVQEEICDLWGNRIEPQDIVISRMHLEPNAALVTAASLMITGADKKLWGI